MFDLTFTAAFNALLYGQAAQTTRLVELETLRIEREIALERARIAAITAGRENFERWLTERQAGKLEATR